MSGLSDIGEAIGIGNKVAPLRYLLFLAILVGGSFGYRAAVPSAEWSDAVAMAFDAAALVFLASLLPLLRNDSADTIRRHAAANDANRPLILVVTSMLTIVAMAAISGELKGAGTGDPPGWKFTRIDGNETGVISM